jgi:EcsC family protein
MLEFLDDASPYVSRKSNACALLSAAEFQRVVEAAEIYVSSRSALTSFISALGNLVDRGMRNIPPEWQSEILRKLHDTLDFAQRAATFQMDEAPGRPSSDHWYTATVLITGAGGGAFGLPSVLAELPITTGVIFRSIADIGRSYGESLINPEFRATCLEVFAYGSAFDEDDDEEVAFVAAKIGAVEIAEFISKVAFRYASAIAPKIAAMSVPIVGSVLGAGVNWAYMSFYQSIARVLFTLLPIERAHDREQVRSCFSSIVREMRAKQEARKRTAAARD